MHLKPFDTAFMRISEAEKGVSRAKALTQQLLTFSRGGAPVRKPASMSQLLVEWCRFALRGSQTSCEFRIQEDLWDADVDEGQVSQVIHNLVVNANQAMPDGGRIYLSANNFISNGGVSTIASGKYIRISVEDEGIGVQPEHLEKIFDPYFTTKEAGSGLGLATSHAIVKKHGGHITVRSQVNKGTSFDVFLPASGPSAPANAEASVVTRPGHGKVLLMDDEQMVRDIAQEMLRILGYRVSLTKDGSEAIDLYRRAKQSGEPFDVVIMDLTVPGRLGGKEAMMLLREYDPDIRAIVSSGYSNDPIMANFRNYGFCGVLSKPYNTKDMSEVLFEVMHDNGTVTDLTSRNATANIE
jgi:CheY-like chemotaxis protein